MAVNFDLRRSSGLREFADLRNPWFVGLIFAVLMAVQALGFLVLGTGRTGRGLAESILVLDSLIALACVWVAFRRAQGITALFWFLFAAVQVVLLVPTVLSGLRHPVRPIHLVGFDLAPALLPLRRSRS